MTNHLDKPPKGSKKQLAFKNKGRILDMYPEVSMRKIGLAIGVDKFFVKQVLIACGREIIPHTPCGKPGCRLPPDLQTKIISLHKSGKPINHIARITSKGYNTISRLLKRHGFDARPCGRIPGTCKFTEPEKKLVVEMREDGQSVNKIAATLGRRCEVAVSKYLHRIGKWDCKPLPENKPRRGAYIGGAYLNALCWRDSKSGTVSTELAEAITLIAQRLCDIPEDIPQMVVCDLQRKGFKFKKGFSGFNYLTTTIINCKSQSKRKTSVVPHKLCVPLDSPVAVALLGCQ